LQEKAPTHLWIVLTLKGIGKEYTHESRPKKLAYDEAATRPNKDLCHKQKPNSLASKIIIR
jgi:hypothetical protein